MGMSVDSLNKCENQAMMCCFGRDRQFGDDNGNCAADDCDDADPGDNVSDRLFLLTPPLSVHGRN